MGAAGGHMPHPFDLPGVKNGNDLINFFKNAIKSIKEEKASLKIDGVNASFKLVDGPVGKEFAGDRASLSPIDIEGITVDKVSRRFAEGHGMIEAYTNLLNIFNEALPEIENELKILGMWDNPTLFFNTEYVEGQTNVLDYDHDFLAIHNMMQIYEKKSKKGYRPGLSRPLDDDGKPVKGFATEVSLDNDQKRAINSLIKKVKRTAINYNFQVYGDVPVRKQEAGAVDLNRPLSEKFTVVYDNDLNQFQSASLEEWLKVAENPRYKAVVLSDGRKASALSKEVYKAILDRKPLSDFLSVPEGVDSSQMAKDAIDGAVFYHATRILGQEVLNALTSDMGPAANHEGVVLRDKELYGVDMVKITGDFILGGGVSPFRKKEDDFKCKRTIALIPGAYKPPHKEHLNMVKHYAKLANIVYVFVSPLSRGDNKPDQYHVTKDMSEKIWSLYLKASGLSRNVKLLPTELNSPVQTSINWVIKNHKRGDCIILGASTKPDDKGVPDVQGRFDRGGIEDYLEAEHNITNDMVEILDPMDPNLVHTYTVDLSATDFRTALQSQDYKAIEQFIPEEVDMNDVLKVFNIPPEPEIELEPELEPESEEITETKKKEVFSTVLYGLIEEVLNEMEPIQKKYAAKHKRNRLTTKGKVKKSPPYMVNPPKERSKSAPPIGEDNPVEFVAGRKSREQACHEDPNCRELEAKKKKKKNVYMEPHMLQDPPDGEGLEVENEDVSVLGEKCWDGYKQVGMKDKGGKKVPNCVPLEEEEELEEISTMGGGSVEGYAGVKKKKDKDEETLIRHEQIINDIVDYLLKTGVN